MSNENLTPEQVLAANGESFFWAKRFLGSRMGYDAARLYSFCRLLDDMADGDIINGPERLQVIYNELSKGNFKADPVLENFSPLFQDYDLDCEVVLALIDGLLDDQRTPVLISSEQDLLRYAYKVAGTVGLMMCSVLKCNNFAAKKHAIDLGIAMQLTNIARDVLEDAQMGRRYIPGDWVNNMSPEEIVEASNNPNSDESILIQDGIKRLLDMAEIFYRSGHHGLAYLPFRAHLSISVAAKVYRQIGVQINNSGLNWYDGRQSTSKLSKIICTIKATFNLLTRASIRKKSHNTSLHSKLEGLPFVG